MNMNNMNLFDLFALNQDLSWSIQQHNLTSKGFVIIHQVTTILYNFNVDGAISN